MGLSQCIALNRTLLVLLADQGESSSISISYNRYRTEGFKEGKWSFVVVPS
jgi:hypothetical protein